MHAFPVALFRKTSITPSAVVYRKIMISAACIIEYIGNGIYIVVNKKAGTLR